MKTKIIVALLLLCAGVAEAQLSFNKFLGIKVSANNTLVGVSAGSAVTTGTKNTYLGRYTGVGRETLSNQIVLSDGDGNIRAINNAGNWLIGKTVDAGYQFDVAGTLRNEQSAYFATTSGNVGIGLAGANAKLEVFVPTIGTTNGIRVTRNTNSNQYIQMDIRDGSKSGIYATGAGKGLEIANNSDNVGTGTSFDGINFNVPSSTAGVTTTAMSILSATGNVGIGTTIPSAKLEVNGGIKATSSNGIAIETGFSTAIKMGCNDVQPLIRVFRSDGTLEGQLRGTGWGDFAVSKGFAIGYSPTGSIVGLICNSSVGIGTQTPASCALLDITSTTKGILLPRMSTTEINAIVSPVAGLTVYNITLACLCFYDGTLWRKVSHSAM